VVGFSHRSYLSAALIAILCIAVRQAAAAPAATTTTLTIASGASSVASGGSVASGSVVTLTAGVTTGATPVMVGMVNFCDASATYCTDIHTLGTAQLTSAGTAVLKFVPGPGSHSYKAVFAGTRNDAGSTSAAISLTVSGPHATASFIAETGGPGN